ncbi:glutamine-synthetase adenylyltransferase [Cognatiyoonia sp. IB215446]|uniref:[protein-PII] uridylyltransferase family protein n=1 Tax=Cognatiyoonia sp. IB215446 TaxID=3097355 RepID=UPI002A0D3A06|nr:glutamine-synthetase adenylyltransferase [Cognatiyoonia sp. IB215446]MDX8349708.1 glutamine-synthetase adenylyltransferase [Cognatiyoonia sp. IB215446]
MSFAAAMTRCPRAYDPDRGADALRFVPDLTGDLARLIVGTAGCSPYLAGLIAKEADWLTSALDDPDGAVRSLIDALAEVALDDLAAHLRMMKRRTALIVALADLGGVWSLKQVTGTLTDFADAAVRASVAALVQAEIARGKLPSHLDPTKGGGMAVLAMGKMGAGELNYSSDIDLICLFDETQFDADAYHDVRAAFVRVTRKMTALLSDVREGGYVFRTDLRLRPDASVTSVCLSMEAAERYYESVGRTWERAAYIKARVCAGDTAAGNRFLETLRPFVWRKHLDFAAIQDAHDMRLKIRDHKGLGGKLTLEGHDMKLGRGGIREIEFFTQTRQLIAGGRDPSLRVRRTDEGLARLAAADWIPPETAKTLTTHYEAHREVEHRVQMINDAQTHHLPGDAAGFERLAAFMDTEAASLRETLTQRLSDVHTLTEGFFAPEPTAPVTTTWGADVVTRWHSYPALRSARATEIFDRLTPEILARLQEAAKPDEALAQFDTFLRGLPAGVQLFSLFEANPQLTQLIVDIAATAPALSQYLSRNAGVLDAVIGGAFFSDWPGVQGLVTYLEAVLGEIDDYETQLIAARRWVKEWHFRIGVHHLRGLIDSATAGRQYADLAEAVIAALWHVVVAEFAHKHGAMPGRGGAVLGMGSLGAGRLNAGSDLDLIMIYDAAGVEASDGRRPLATRAYFARLTQALVTALSAPMSEGRLYEVDMRLRPSGRQGPVATSFDAFRTYQRDEAWTWEHLALTRGRVVAGDAGLAGEIEAFRTALLAEKANGPTVLADVAEMRRRIAEAKPPQGDWDAKIGPGRLQDIELFAQTAALRSKSPARDIAAQLQAGVADGWLDAADAQAMTEATRFLWGVQAAAGLLTGGALDPDTLGEGAKRLILRESACDDLDGLLAKLVQARDMADKIITRMLKEDAT